MSNTKRAPDGGPMWSRDSVGHYWLMFPNKHALDIDEIRQIFSEFGHVRQITRAGDEKGLRFIQYTSLEDTEKAIESLSNHPTVSLRPHRQLKTKPSTNNDDSFEADNKSAVASTVEASCKKNMYQRKNPVVDPISPPERKQKFKHCSDVRNSSNDSLFKKLKDLTISKANGDENFNESGSMVSASDSPNLRKSGSRLFEGLKKSLIPSHNAETTSCVSNNNLTHILDYDDDDDDDLPDLVIKEKIVKPKKICLDAGEVIVGNIDPYFGPGYLLHLFANYEPIAVSYIQIVPDTGLRYCHVYFKNVQESKEVEKRFDMHKLAGKKLIVMSPSKLAQEARLRRS